MTDTSLSNTATTAQKTGLEDVVRSVRALARQTRGLAEGAAGVAERELAMGLSVAEQLRDALITKEALAQSRSMELIARLRLDAHRALDLAMDAAATTYVFGVKFVEAVVDRPREAAGEVKSRGASLPG